MNESTYLLKIYTTLGYIVSLLFRYRKRDSETRGLSSRGLVKQYNQELCISSIQDVSPRGFSRDH